MARNGNSRVDRQTQEDAMPRGAVESDDDREESTELPVNEFQEDVQEDVQETAVRYADDNASLIYKQIQDMDRERLQVAARLVNTFNHAIQVQAGRNEWTADDYIGFIIAMRAIDNIGVGAADALETKRLENDIRETLITKT